MPETHNVISGTQRPELYITCCEIFFLLRRIEIIWEFAVRFVCGIEN